MQEYTEQITNIYNLKMYQNLSEQERRVLITNILTRLKNDMIEVGIKQGINKSLNAINKL